MSLVRHRAAVTTFFFVSGFLFASFFARIPALQRDLGLSDGTLGLALFADAAAALIAQPLTGALAVRFGSRRLTVIGALVFCSALAVTAVPDGAAGFLAALVVMGAAAGVLDVAMNVQGIAVESSYRRRIFTSLHGAFSFGAVGGAATAGVAAEVGLEPLAHFAIVGGGLALVVAVASRGLLGDADAARGGGRSFARPTRPLAVLGVLAFCALLVEGAVANWSALYLDRSLGATPGMAAAGLTVFSITMGAGRLAGDRLAERVGAVRVVRLGGATATIGIALALLASTPALAVAAFALMGAGLAAVFPLTLNAAARQPGTPSAPGIAAVSTAGYGGLMLGPAIIGGLSQATALPTALLLVVALSALATALGSAVRRADRATSPA